MNISKIGEFGLIDMISSHFPIESEGIIGIGDDCAVIPQNSELNTLVSCDLLIEGTHFLRSSITPFQLGWKSAAVNISDIAAMGGKLCGSFLSLALPDNISFEWVEEFIRGYKALSLQFSCPLLGGDTTKSLQQICVNVSVLGTCPKGKEIKRSNAKVGDLICVTGVLGDSAAGLKLILDGDLSNSYFIDKHYTPLPRVKEGLYLSNLEGIGAMMDISDGIGSDLRHILKASNKSAIIDTSLIPLSEPLKELCKQKAWNPLDFALNGGEDYELLFTLAPNNQPLNISYSIIGQITERTDTDIIWKGTEMDFYGFTHF